MIDTSPKINIDKNLAFSVMELRRNEDTLTEKIIKSLLIYFSLSYQEDLWGYKTLDPHHFAKTMNFSTANLFRKHPNPEYLQYQSKTSIKWDSYLENALFILFTKPVFQEYKTISEEFESIKIVNFIVLKEIELIQQKKAKTKKFYYKYQLDGYFEQNIRRFFLQTRIDLYITCEKKNISDFYLYIANIYNGKRRGSESKYYFTLESLVEFFKISPNLEPRHKKAKINKYFKEAEKILSEEIAGLKFNWTEKGSRWAYTPYMEWTPKNSEIIKKEDDKIMSSTFLKILRRSLYELYIYQYKGLPEENSFFQWMKADENLEVKKSTYINTMAMHQQLPKYPSPETFAISFFRSVKVCKTVEDLKNLFVPKEIIQ